MTAISSDVAVIGGGLAGAGTAYAFAQRGLSVTLLEGEPTLAAKASGNAWGLFMPYIATQSSSPGILYARGFDFSRELLGTTLKDQVDYCEVGAIQLPATKRLARLLVESTQCLGRAAIRKISAEEGAEIAGINLPSGSFFMPNAGFCRPALVAERLARASRNISVNTGSRVDNVAWDGSGWRLSLQNGDAISTPIVVLCGAYEVTSLSISSWVPLEAIRGQTAQARASSESSKLRTVISYDGYITPEREHQHFVGAHYRHDDYDPEPKESDTAAVMARLHRALPAMNNVQAMSSRVCFRASTHDRMPYIGSLPVSSGHHLFINAGHGSRGLLTAPLGGEIAARLALGESLKDLSDAAMVASAARLERRFPLPTG